MGGKNEANHGNVSVFIPFVDGGLRTGGCAASVADNGCIRRYERERDRDPSRSHGAVSGTGYPSGNNIVETPTRIVYFYNDQMCYYNKLDGKAISFVLIRCAIIKTRENVFRSGFLRSELVPKISDIARLTIVFMPFVGKSSVRSASTAAI